MNVADAELTALDIIAEEKKIGGLSRATEVLIELAENMKFDYGNRGDGIALGFDSKIVTSTLERIFPCLYNRAELVRYIVLTLTKLEELNPTESQTDAKWIKGYQLGYLTASI